LAQKKRKKNLEILRLACKLTRRIGIGAGRIVSCKSAKDRTAMSVTWEQACSLYEKFGVSRQEMTLALRLMRLEGVRRRNVEKNTGQSHYAFNKLQRSMLPIELRPPISACGSSLS